MIRLIPLPFLFFASFLLARDWPQAAGPDGDFIVSGKPPATFSVSRGENVRWRANLPNTGQGTPVVSGGRVFVTSHGVIEKDTKTGATILGLCFDAKTGKELWRRTIPGTRSTDLSSLFNDNTAASPVADGKRVVFTNVGGTIQCFDYEGTAIWARSWTPFGRHHARAHEPILHDGKVILMHAPRYDLSVAATTKAGSHRLGRGKEFWTFLRAYDLATGDFAWQAEPGTSVHSTSMAGILPDGRHALLTGRGGGHQPPEEPYGLSLVDASNGKSIWDCAIQGYAAAQNANWSTKTAHFFLGQEHRSIEIGTGKRLSAVSLTEGVTVTRWKDGQYLTLENQSLPKARKPITYFTNVLVGDYHYFRSFSQFLIGRVNLRNGKVEYLQVPPQVVRNPGRPDEKLWVKSLPNDMKNADGFRATQDKRNAGNGWGHVSSASPIVVGDFIYFPTMVGMVYVLEWNRAKLDEKALHSLSDLGLAGETWSLSSLAYADGLLYARTMKELICLGEKTPGQNRE
jgi:outer membrane protein assembly factor BamB